uniref:J domain-containing protein n=1 Tax=Vitis vinifera TaxID=29760 RepID=F6HDI6_VITVI
MDCNKEEAVRAKGLAEKKMQNKDFVGARKIAIKAQQLYPDLENISQMLTVCDVHCSAEHKLIGNEIDWYGVLQIEQTADEASIKKQYRKLALLLHPDKNKFSGAEAAFKLIGEAQRVLLDREKRSLHDMRRKACMKPKAAHQTQPRANKNVNFGRQSGVQNSSMNNAATTYAGPAFPQQKPVPNQDAHKVGPQSTFQKPASNVGFQGKFGAKSPGKVNGKKRKKQEVESSESCDTGSSSDTEELVMEEDDDLPAKQNYGQKSEDVSLKENICKINKQAGAAADVEEDKKDSGQKGTGSFDESLPNGTKETKKDNGKETVTDDACKRTAKDPEFYEYPDPDFNDFDKDRKEECFTVGQTWAVYDTVDAMPRFYAQIRKVFSTGFKLRITWLEPDPSDEAEIEWVSEDLPYSCGNFKRGKSENTGDRLMFSHLVSWEKDRSRDAYKIHPRKGETWALFKNWDIKWSSDPESHRKYEFEYVEVLSEYDENVGISVVYLSKLKGFACLFCRILKQGIDSILIPPSELLRFSHRIPSFKLTGEERQDVPRGSLELDPASLPANVEEIPVPEEDLKMEASNANSNGSNGNPDDILKDHSSDPASVVASTPEAYEIPEPDFCNFDAEKSPEKFQVGQIWALYSDEDGLPKYYCQIKKIDSDPDFKLHVTWLEACSPPNDMIQWLDKKMLTTCGRFKIKKGKPQTYTSAASFSHQLRAELTDKKNEYAIFPRKGEVWALYKNWNAEMTCSDLENCEYDIVEVLDENDLWIEVLLLERVEGYNAVFKSQVEGRLPFSMKIPRVELLRFSHQIPAFHLTEERDGALKGNLELDPASLPILLFCSN